MCTGLHRRRTVSLPYPVALCSTLPKFGQRTVLVCHIGVINPNVNGGEAVCYTNVYTDGYTNGGAGTGQHGLRYRYRPTSRCAIPRDYFRCRFVTVNVFVTQFRDDNGGWRIPRGRRSPTRERFGFRGSS